MFKNGKFDGKGIYYFPNRTKDEGIFKEVKFVKSISITPKQSIEKVVNDNSTQTPISSKDEILSLSNYAICNLATFWPSVGARIWDTCKNSGPYIEEVRRRGLRCGVNQNAPVCDATDGAYPKLVEINDVVFEKLTAQAASAPDSWVCANVENVDDPLVREVYSDEAKRRGFVCSNYYALSPYGQYDSKTLCEKHLTLKLHSEASFIEKEVERRGLNCSEKSDTVAELEGGLHKPLEAESELTTLKAGKEEQQLTFAVDKQAPLITITQSVTEQRKGIIRGFARDNVQIGEVLVDGLAVKVASDGSFEWTGFVPVTGKSVIIEAIDTAALSSSKVIRLERGQMQQTSGPRFDDLDPTTGKRVARNQNALALIVGISDYERTDAPAIYADKDAQYFHDYASLKLGIPDSSITTLVNDKAEQGDVLLAVKDWLRRSSKPGKSDIYIFFAGHGLASQDGEQMYLLPFDGRPRLLDETAILREKLFSDIAAANPRSVTVFLDTCYSGTTRGPDMLIASRPIAIRAKEQAVPEGFTVMTAAAGDQTAKPLEEAKHGMFSYFLMKGMEGDADANQDNQITARELHAYVQQNVIQQSSGSQTPELQGDADRVLVRFQ